MKQLSKKDLEGVFLAVIRKGKNDRECLPVVRRHFRSIAALCRAYIERHVDIYYSGLFVAEKKAQSSKIVMDKDYREAQPEQPFIFELR